MTKRILCLALLAMIAGNRPAWARQDEMSKLRAALAEQQAAIAKLVQRIDELEKKQGVAVTKDDLEDEAKTQQDSVNSLRETLLGKVNISGYSNFRAVTDGSERASAFQLDHLGLILAKQLGRFNFLTELELQNVPHHAESADGTSNEAIADISGEGQVAVENAWMEYNHNSSFSIRAGKQLSPQYWWQHRYPNLTYSTDLPIYLRELFPPELVGVMVRGQLAKPIGTSEFGLGYSVYVANNDVEGNSQADLQDAKAWGGRLQFKFPTGGALKRLDVAADIYRGHTAEGKQVLHDDVNGVEGQLEISRFLLSGEYARGQSDEMTRSGFYLQPAVQLHPDWLAFYRLEQLESPRIQRAERRHLAGVNFRPFAQVAFKAEYYRSIPLSRSFMRSEEERKRYNGFATAAVFFF